MKVLWTKNQGNILLCEKHLIRNISVLLLKKLTKKNSSLLLHQKKKMGFDVAICKFKMHLSWHTLRRWGYIHVNYLLFNYIWHHLLFNYIWHLSCLLCMFILRSHPKTKLQILFHKKLKDLQRKKNHQTFFK
jgi:hypothetical protein